jgi:hypothetical protein
MRIIRDFSTVASLSSIRTESDSSPVLTKDGRVLGIKTSSRDMDGGMIEEIVGNNNVIFGFVKNKSWPTLN